MQCSVCMLFALGGMRPIVVSTKHEVRVQEEVVVVAMTTLMRDLL